ncbi:putative DNA-binding domain-containing protein [Undibacterium sp. Ji49W]|uniref:HvfC/BufC family peptide modification chaperone n=1 Tax=Undibacterium sp. Ji49W TaxID=3413040 RepID=UPI003BF15518
MNQPLPDPSLSQLQNWFLTVMTAPGGLERGLSLAQEHLGLAESAVIKTAPGKQSRMHIYAHGYILRLQECLQADFPVLHRLMGNDLFNFFAHNYIWRHPSRAPSLYDLGAGFADFLQQSQPTSIGGENAGEADLLLQFPIEIARLERAFTEVIRAPGLEQDRNIKTHHAFDLLMGSHASIHIPACVRLLKTSFPLLAYWEQAKHAPADQDLPAPPDPETSYLAFTRQNYRVQLISLLPWQYHFLLAAYHHPDLHQCAVQASKETGLDIQALLADICLWQPQAQALGLLTTEKMTLI